MSDAEASKLIGKTKGGAIAALAVGIVIFGGIGFLGQPSESPDDARGGAGFSQNTVEEEVGSSIPRTDYIPLKSDSDEELIAMNKTDTSVAANTTDNDQ